MSELRVDIMSQKLRIKAPRVKARSQSDKSAESQCDKSEPRFRFRGQGKESESGVRAKSQSQGSEPRFRVRGQSQESELGPP